MNICKNIIIVEIIFNYSLKYTYIVILVSNTLYVSIFHENVLRNKLVSENI